jgi:hypothetical protein
MFGPPGLGRVDSVYPYKTCASLSRIGEPFPQLNRGESVFSNLAADDPRPGLCHLREPYSNSGGTLVASPTIPLAQPFSPGLLDEKRESDGNSGSDLMMPPLFSREPSINQPLPFLSGQGAFTAVNKDKKY